MQSYTADVQAKTGQFILAGLTFVVGLSWNDTIKKGIHTAWPNNSDNFTAMLIYSLILTIIAVLIASVILKAPLTPPPAAIIAPKPQ